MESRQLYRPVGLYELRLIQESGYRNFPPRLSHQPFFYPVLNYDYALQIARDWNTTDEASGFMGAITTFDVNGEYLAQFETQVVGASHHQELWIPSENLDEFNRNIVGAIRILTAYYGEKFSSEKAW